VGAGGSRGGAPQIFPKKFWYSEEEEKGEKRKKKEEKKKPSLIQTQVLSLLDAN